MFVGLKRYAYAPIAALALWAVVLMASPTTANAQETSQATNRDADGAAHVVVAPGDSLWSISARQLGPGATAPQIANGVELIWALNRDQIGADPNTIFAGQKFVLPPVVERQTPEPARAAPARGTAATAKVEPTGRVARSDPDRAFRPKVGEPSGRGRKAPEAALERRTLPDEAAVALVPVVRSLAADGTPGSPTASFLGSARAVVLSTASALVESFFVASDPYAGRKLLGVAILAMSSVLALVLALLVAREVRSIRHATPRVRERRVRSKLGRNQAFLDHDPHGGPSVALGRRAPARGAQGAAKPASVGRARRRAVSEQSRNGSDPSDGLRKHARFTAIAKSEQARLRRARTRRLGRLPCGSNAPARQGRARRARLRTMNRRTTMGDKPGVPDTRRGWEISEPLRCALENLPLQLREPARKEVLAELKPQVEDELKTLALLERRRHLSNREQRQESALRDLLALIE